MADILNGSRFGMYGDVNGNLWDLLCHATNMGSTMEIY